MVIHSQNLMRSKLDHDPSFDFSLQEDPGSSVCVILLTNTLTNGQTYTNSHESMVTKKMKNKK